MKTIHLTWRPELKAFDNSGELLIWVESTQGLAKRSKNNYQHSLNHETALPILDAYFKDCVLRPCKAKLPIPVNNKGEPIPSSMVANYHGMEDTQPVDFKTLTVECFKSNSTLGLLKALNFGQYYLDEETHLAGDCQFWITMGKVLSQIIKHDQYICDFATEKKNGGFVFHSVWQALSDDFDAKLGQLSKSMPLSASTLGASVEPESLLKHFSDVILTEFIAQTAFAQKYYKLVEESLIEPALDAQDNLNISEDQWVQWKLWRNNLEYTQRGAPFRLVFKLLSPQSETGDWFLEVLLQSKSDPSCMVDLATYQKNKLKESQFYQKMFGTSMERSLLLQLGYAARLYSPIDFIFKTHLKESNIPLTQSEAFEFLKESAWTLHASGYRIVVPAWWTNKGRLKAKVKIKARDRNQQKLESAKGHLSFEGLVGFDYKLAIGAETVSKSEWATLLESKSDLVFFRGEWIEIDPNEMQRIQNLIESSENDQQLGSIRDLLDIAANDQDYDLDMDEALQSMMNRLFDKDLLKPLPNPKGLKAKLRPYQKRGLSWLAYLESLGMHPCLADDMGLGKTMQMISLLLSKPMGEPALLVAPTSVIGNWDREIKKFAPSISTFVYHGSQRQSKESYYALNNSNLVITSYGLLRKDKSVFQARPWSRLILDEAQNIKNPLASQTKAICSINAESRIALTGTPIENRLMDLWSLFHFLNPGFLGDKTFFKKAFEIPVQRDNDQTQARVLKRMVEPFILRRLKTDKSIIKDLPDKIEQKVYCQLTKEQASIYQSIVDHAEKQLNETEASNKQAIFISSLLRLKQACNHPAQALQDGSEFSPERSVKLKRLLEMSQEIIDAGDSLLIFSQFTEICDSLHKMLREHLGVHTHYLHGGTSRKQREKMIEQFQAEDAKPSIFILSLKAGGVGITLTRANHVIHFDRWWNPAVENQATDRAYRIGQEKTVFAYKFITTGTVEESIDQMLEDKQKVTDMIVGNDESWLSKLDAKTFIDLIKLKQEMVTES